MRVMLARLNHAGEIKFTTRRPGKAAYVWNHEFTPQITIAAKRSDLKHFINAAMSSYTPRTKSKKGSK